MIFFTDSKRTFDKIWYPIMIKSLRRLGKKENIFKLIKLFIKNIQLSVQLLSHVWLFATPWIAACQASLSITNSQLLKLMSIESVMPSNHLIFCLPPSSIFNFSQHQGLFQWVRSSHQVTKVLELQLQH